MVVMTLGALLLSHPILEPMKKTICSNGVHHYNEAEPGYEDVLEPTNPSEVPPESAKNYSTDREIFLEIIEKRSELVRERSDIKISNKHKANINDGRKNSKNSDVFEYYGQLPDDTIDAFVQWFKVHCYLFDYDCEKMARKIKKWKNRNKL
eukprot:sb/3473518/